MKNIEEHSQMSQILVYSRHAQTESFQVANGFMPSEPESTAEFHYGCLGGVADPQMRNRGN